MSNVLLVKIEKTRDLKHYRCEDPGVTLGDTVVIPWPTGEELGEVVNQLGESLVGLRHFESIPQILRRATARDLDAFRRKAEDEEGAARYCQERIRDGAIPIKLIRVSFYTAERKAIFYFTSEGRIDFRDLVKDLARKLRMRIEMRQIGIRDEARMVGGLGVCGCQLCCKVFLNNLEPITLQMAKKQNLNMNPAKISGQCGRLMCCLSYEEEAGVRAVSEAEPAQSSPDSPVEEK